MENRYSIQLNWVKHNCLFNYSPTAKSGTRLAFKTEEIRSKHVRLPLCRRGEKNALGIDRFVVRNLDDCSNHQVYCWRIDSLASFDCIHHAIVSTVHWWQSSGVTRGQHGAHVM